MKTTIIGSGLGGLTCAYILAKNGFQVQVLEQNAQLGGCLQTFVRKGVKFETGMHYIGSSKEGQPMHRYLSYLNVLPKVQLSPLNPQGFDVVSFHGEQYHFGVGADNFVEQLSQSFPSERNNLRRYIQDLQRIIGISPFHSLGSTTEMLMSMDIATTSVNDFIASFTSNPTLQNVLAGTAALYAGVKDKTPMYIHAFINESNIAGPHRIVGGSDKIAISLIQSIRAFGGEVRPLSKVVKINCNATKAVSLTLADGETLETDLIVSDAHPETTLRMLDTPLIRSIYRNRIYNMEQTIGNFTLYLHFKPNTMPYQNYNAYHYHCPSVWDAPLYRGNGWSQSYLYMHLCPEESDPPGSTPKYATCAEVLAYMRFEELTPWFNTTVGHRGSDYKDLMQSRAEQLLDVMERDYPGLRSKLSGYYTSSPLTYRDYTGTVNGSMYGILHDKSSFIGSRISHRTKVPNLRFTGQNINSHGAMGVVISSMIVCAELLGFEFLMKQIIDSE